MSREDRAAAKTLYLFLIILVLIVTVYAASAKALSCDYDNAPYLYLTSRPSALCVVGDASSKNCYTYLSNPENDSEVWGSMPIGDARSYSVVNGAAAVEFSRDRLYANKTATATVVCGAETFSFNFTPQYVDYSEVGESWIKIGDNAEYLIVGFLLLLFVSAVAYFFYWRFK